jgi:short-subunit dehydrogenase
MKLKPGTVAVVTGAASGIGRAIATTLHQRGCSLALVDIDEAGLLELKSALNPSTLISLHGVNVSDRQAMLELPEAVLQPHGRVSLLVNSAGVSVAAPFSDLELDDFAWLMNINFWGTVYACKFFLPLLQRESESHICNILSDFALLGLPTKAAYVASKFAVRGFSETLQAELHGSSVSLSCIYPGPVATNIVKKGRAWNASRQEAEANFLEKNSLDVKDLAETIRKAIEYKRRRVLVGKETYLMDIAARMLPGFLPYLIGRLKHRVPFL